MADWQTVSSLATASGTLVLAVATFSAVRSSSRSARIAERSLLTSTRPLILPSLHGDPVHKVLWNDRHMAVVSGGRAVFEEENGVIYLAMSLRNIGSGLALLHGWYPIPEGGLGNDPHAPLEDFRRLTIDLYIPAGGTGYWEGAVRDTDDPARSAFVDVLKAREPTRIDLLYGDQHGGQRTISRFIIIPGSDEGWYALGARHWNIDQPDPR